VIRYPRKVSSVANLEPMKPAPPETNTFLISAILRCFATFFDRPRAKFLPEDRRPVILPALEKRPVCFDIGLKALGNQANCCKKKWLD
jgi:hypothetical protein